MTTIKRRLDQLEKRAAPVIKAQNTIRVYVVADHPDFDLVTFDEYPALGLLAVDVDRAHDPAAEWDMSGLSAAHLEAFLAAIPVPDDTTLDELGAQVVAEMIAYIRAGEISFQALADEFNHQIASEVFRRAGVKP